MNKKFPSSICPKSVTNKYNAVCCDICYLWAHIKYSNITKYCYRILQNDKEPWNSKRCIKNIVPFSQLSDKLINNWMLGSIMRSPKQILQENQKIFPNDKQNFVTMSL